MVIPYNITVIKFIKTKANCIFKKYLICKINNTGNKRYTETQYDT